MTPEEERKTLFFENNPVGYFIEEPLPSAPGRYQYMPYRGVAHYKLGVALKSGPQRCHYLVDGKKHPFTVVTWISYGVLELSDFDSPEP